MRPRRILREAIPVDDLWHTIELQGPIVHVASREEGAVEIWWLDDPALPAEARSFRVVGTGQPLAPALAHHVGTAITPSGRFVWHLMEHERGAAGG